MGRKLLGKSVIFRPFPGTYIISGGIGGSTHWRMGHRGTVQLQYIEAFTGRAKLNACEKATWSKEHSSLRWGCCKL